MNYKHFFITIYILLSSVKGFSQDPERKNSIGLYQTLTDYNVVLFDNKIFAFDSSLSQSTRIAYQRKLSRTWMINTGLSNGFILNQNIRESFVERAYVFGMDAALFFKLNNGRILKENPRIAPYLTFGYRMDYIPHLSKINEDPLVFMNQYGLGFNVKLSERTHIQLQTVLDQKLASDFNTHMQYRIGLTQSLGALEDKLPDKKQSNDADNDGIVDAMDKCPTIYGLMKYGGCPTDSFGEIVQNDSLERVVFDQRLELEKLQMELEEIRNAGESTSISKSREQELLLRIYKLQKSKDEEILALKRQISDNEGNGILAEDEAKKKEELALKEKQAKELAEKEKKEKELAEKEKKERELAGKEVSPETPKEKEIEVDNPTIPEDKNYYVITISSPNLSTATAWLAKMKKSYPDAVILPQPNGYYRVGVYVGKDKPKGLKTMEQVRNEGYTSVWLSVE